MNQASVAEQKSIFESPLESAEVEAVNTLVSRHKANAALTQQLALDASKLVATSQGRLTKQANAGFFKRLASALSGKTTENQLQNQSDMLHMQKCAWHFLQQLQQQNLINAQGIAVIRNNLGTMNDYIIETRDFLELAIDKIDHRLRHVENNTSFNTWSLNIEANKRRYKSTPKTLLILRLTFDFMRQHQHVVLGERDINYLVTTLEKLDINCDEEIKLLDFISELIDQVEVVGIEQYRQIIDLSFDGHVVDSSFILNSISGIGFNALYYLGEQFEKIQALINDDELCNTDDAREKIISRFFGNEFVGLSTTYRVRDLICEIAGGGQLAIDIYKEENGLNAVLDEQEQTDTPDEVVSLTSSLPELRSHSFFDAESNEESRRNYILLLALSVENSSSLTGLALEFITALSEKAGHPELYKDVVSLADNPRRLSDYLPVMQKLLDDDNKKYAWLLDAFFLLTLAGKSVENHRIKAIVGTLKPAALKECLPNMLIVVNEADETSVLEATFTLANVTRGWKNVVRYRNLQFKDYFSDTSKKLWDACLGTTELLLKVGEVNSKSFDYATFLNSLDGGFFANLTDKAGAAFYSQGRKSTVSALNEVRKKASELITVHSSALYHANVMMDRWAIPRIEFKGSIPPSNFDLDNSAENEDWHSHFEHYYRQVEGGLEEFSQTCTDAADQISLFMSGNFDSSIVEIKTQRKIEQERDYLLQQEREKLEKESVTLFKDGQEHTLRIDWEMVEHPPCDPENIIHIKTNGKVWLIVASINSDEVFYRSEDGRHWQQVHLDVPDVYVSFHGIDVVNGIWIIKNRHWKNTRDEGFYYSEDAINWRHCAIPNASANRNLSLRQGMITYGEVVYFAGVWLWKAVQSQSYKYTEKGFFSDSTKEGFYTKTVLFSAPSVAGPWQRWEHNLSLPDGVEVKSLRPVPGRDVLLAFCEYSPSYQRDKKQPESPPFVMYFGARKNWQKCTWNGDANSYRLNILMNSGEQVKCLGNGQIYTSDKGYEWSKGGVAPWVDEHFPLTHMHLFMARNSSSTLYLTQDGETFKEIRIPDGSWRYLSANDEGVLGTHYVNQHEGTTLQFGRLVCKTKA